MGRWIVGIVIMVGLLCAALFASSAAHTSQPPVPTPVDDFSLGVIAANPGS